MAFREISVEQLKDNPFTLINKDWMLITAGDGEKHNTMTASWGGVGELWGRVCVHHLHPAPAVHAGVCGAGGVLLPVLLRAGVPAGPEPVREQIRPGGGQGRRHRPDPLLRRGRPLLRAGAAGVPLPQAVPPGLGGRLPSWTRALLEKWYDNDLHRMFIGEIVKVLEKE